MFCFALITTILLSASAGPVPEAKLTDAQVEVTVQAMSDPKLYGGDMLVDSEINNEAAGTPWPNAILYYVIDNSLSGYRNEILDAMREFASKTCLRFRQRRNERDYIILKDGWGCSSWVGRIGGAQDINLAAPGCLYHGTILHELGHAIGFRHTHQRQDRDNHINIHWENVDENFKYAFDKQSGGRDLVGYDTSSIMHYYSRAFPKAHGLITMTKKDGSEISYANILSDSDVVAINKLYCW